MTASVCLYENIDYLAETTNKRIKSTNMQIWSLIKRQAANYFAFHQPHTAHHTPYTAEDQSIPGISLALA